MSSYTAGTLVKIALKEVGYLEKRSDANLNDKTANAGSANYTKYGKTMHKLYPAVMDYPAAWCDCFVDWCHWKAAGESVIDAKTALRGDLNDWTVASKQYYVKAGKYGAKPRIGAQIFFKNSAGVVCHTGIVYGYDKTYVYTVEGNTSGASGVVANGGGVCCKKYARTHPGIDGYGYPKYASSPKKCSSFRIMKDISIRESSSKVARKVGTFKRGAIIKPDGLVINKAGNTWMHVTGRGWACIEKRSGTSYVTKVK